MPSFVDANLLKWCGIWTGTWFFCEQLVGRYLFPQIRLQARQISKQFSSTSRLTLHKDLSPTNTFATILFANRLYSLVHATCATFFNVWLIYIKNKYTLDNYHNCLDLNYQIFDKYDRSGLNMTVGYMLVDLVFFVLRYDLSKNLEMIMHHGLWIIVSYIGKTLERGYPGIQYGLLLTESGSIILHLRWFVNKLLKYFANESNLTDKIGKNGMIHILHKLNKFLSILFVAVFLWIRGCRIPISYYKIIANMYGKIPDADMSLFAKHSLAVSLGTVVALGVVWCLFLIKRLYQRK